MATRRSKRTYNYNCTITDRAFKLTRQAPNPEELISVNAYYELNPDKDDRPLHVQISAKEALEAAEKAKEEQELLAQSEEDAENDELSKS